MAEALSPEVERGAAPARRPGLLRRTYAWVLSWAESPHGATALFVLAFVESSFFPIPPDVLLIALCLGAPGRAFRFATICSAGSVAGGIAGYGIGLGFWAALDDVFFRYVPGFTPEVFARVQALYEEWAFWAVFAAAFTPIPYKVFTIAAGVFGVSFVPFVIASAAGRSARFFLVASAIFLFGPPVKRIIDRYFELLTLAFTALLVLGFVAIKWFTAWWR